MLTWCREFAKVVPETCQVTENHSCTFTGTKLRMGSYGIVYEAEWKGTVCATKRLHEILLEDDSSGGSDRIVSNFEQECLTWSKLRHCAVLQFLGVYREPRSPLPVNTFVAKVSDFGMSRAVNPSNLARKSSIKGTVVYMAPEALQDPPWYSEKCDIFSFGVGVMCVPIHTKPTYLKESIVGVRTELEQFQPNATEIRSAFSFKALNELFTRHLLTAEECSEVARKGKWKWEDHLNQVLLTKPAEVVLEACQVLEKHGFPVKEELKMMKTLHSVKHILNEEECRSVGKAGHWWNDELAVVIVVKGAVQETLDVLEEYKGRRWYDITAKGIKMLSELYQKKLLTEDEVKRMKGEGRNLSDRVVFVQFTKPPEVVAKSAIVLDKYGHNEEASLLRALNELFTRHLLTAEEFSEVARKKRWEEHLNQVLLTKPAEVVQEASQVLEKHGLPVNKELKKPEIHPTWRSDYEEAVKKQGSVTVAINCCIFAGPPGKGKSCLKHLLVHDKPKEVKTSTGVMEKPDVVTISAEKYAVEGTSVWLPLADDEMASSIKSCQTCKYHIPEDGPEDQYDKLAQPIIKINHPIAASKATSRSSRADPSDTVSDSLHLQPSANTADAQFVHLLDTGGQPSFQAVLPLLLDVPCTYVLVFNAAEGLNAPVPITYRPDDTTVVESGLRPETAWAMMLRSLSSAYTVVHKLSGDVRALLVDNRLPPLRTVIVGTFADQLEQMDDITTATEEIGRQIKQLENKPYYSSLIPNSDGQLFHLMNNLPHLEASERTPGEQASINKLREILSHPAGALNAKIPMRWYHFEMVSRMVDQKFFNVSELLNHARELKCITSADPSQFHSLQQLFHSLGVFTFINCEDVSHMVCTDSSVFLQTVSKLLAVEFKVPKCPAVRDFKETGILSLDTRLFNELGISKEVDPVWLLRCLCHLGVADCLPLPSADTLEYFIPAVLPSQNKENVSEHGSVAPLMVAFQFQANAFLSMKDLPHGIFARLAVELANKGWKVVRDGNTSLAIRFQWKDVDISIVEYAGCISIVSVHANCSVAEHCTAVRSTVEAAIQTSAQAVFGSKFTEKAKPVFAFECPCEALPTHVAVPSRNTLVCSLSSEYLTSGKVWFCPIEGGQGYGSSSSERSPIESSVDQSLILEESKATFDGKRRTVGGGSFGTVYLGRFKGEKCAIKVFNSGVVQKNIEKELQLASIVQHHPNVVLVHGLWFGNPANQLPNDQAALVMELCSINLWNYFNDKKEKGDKVLFSLNAKLEILSDVAAGMIYLHSEQIVHSDLAAINILLNIKGTEVVAKVADFDQARILNADTLRRVTATHRKSDYMPPEVKSSQGPVELTKAVDVFSFGCLMTHVASCVYPEPRPDPLGGRSNYQMRVHYINDKQSHVFESVTKRCLEERPTARGTFEDAMEDIQVLLRKYAKNRQTETPEGRNRDIEKMKSDMLKLQRFNKDLQEEHATLSDTCRRVQEEKSSMESKMNALVACSIIGNAESGKSTLIAALQADSNSFMGRIVNCFRRGDDPHQQTAGIETVTQQSQKYRKVLFYDFAGQYKYHGLHQIFLESLLSKPGETMTLLVVRKMTEDAVLHQLRHWLTPVALMATPASPPQVIVIGSFLDEAKSKEEASAKLMQHHEEGVQQRIWLNRITVPVLNADQTVSGKPQKKAYDEYRQFQLYIDVTKAGYPVNVVTSDGSCSLHFAVGVGNIGMFGEVLSTGCEIHDGRNPMHPVLQNGGSEGTLEMIKFGADKTMVASAFGTPLHRVELSDPVSTVKSLLKLGCSVDVVDRNGRGVSHSADEDSKAELIGKLLIAGSDINAAGSYNCEPLADVKLDGDNKMICRCDIQTAHHICSHLQELPIHSLAIDVMLPFDFKTFDELEICDPVYPIALSQCSHAQEEQEIMCDDGIIVPKRATLSLVHEEVLDIVCFSFELNTLCMTSTGGVFTLEPHGINIEVPPGAVSPSESVDLRYAVIVDGPFTLPEGYKLGSMVVYLYYDGRRLTKPITLSLPHWYGGEDQVRDGLSFAMAPHTLKEGENSYRFQLLEGGRFKERDTIGILQIDGHSTLFGAVFKKMAISRYLASFWQSKENGTHYRAAITYDCSTWLEILKMFYPNFVDCDERAKFVFSDEEACCGELSQRDGPGWKASISGISKVSPVDVEFHTKFTESTLEQEVANHLYPPAINVVVQYERPPEPNSTRSSVHLYIDGPKEGRVNFPFEVFNINPVGLSNEAACALLTHTREFELKATAMDHGNARQQVELLKGFLDVISSELDVKENGRAMIEQRLKKTEQDLKAKEEECYAFETAQLNLLQQVEELKREKQLLEAQEIQRNAELVQMRGELTKAEAACGQLERLAAMKEENEALKHWQKRAKKVEELENQLNKERIEFATERRACVELQERLEREVIAKMNLERERDSAVERAECLHAQLNEMHTDLEKLRKVQVLKLHERTCFIEELKECEQQLKDELKTLKRAFNSVSLELAEGKGKMQHMEEHLRASISAVKSKEEECYTFESTQLDLLQQVEELKREKQLLEAQVTQQDAELAKMRALYKFPSGEHKSELVQLREELKAKDDALQEMYSKMKELHVLKAQLEATLVNYEANRSQLESAQLLKFQALSERDRYMEMTSALQKKLLDKEEAKMACEKEIHMLRREVEAAKKRYQDLKDEKETLADHQFVELDDLRSRFSVLQSELEAVREEHDVVKLHRYLYNSNLRQMVSDHLDMRDKLLVVVKDSLDMMQKKIIHNVKDFTSLDTAQETVAEHVKEAESQYKAAEKELRKLERVAEKYRCKLLDLPHPTEEELWNHVVPVVAARWREVATYLGLESHVITAVHVAQSSAEDSCLKVLLRWMDGAGKQPKTWLTVLEAMRRAGFTETAKELEVKIRSNSL